jgi:ectoine hydroxylase-related dioxygenase (phytanoyl-CoA dioxygenase family)
MTVGSDIIDMSDIEAWRTDGVLIKKGLISAEDLEPSHVDFHTVYELTPPEEMAENTSDGRDAADGQFHVSQLQPIRPLPALGAPDLNLLPAHPKILKIVKALLGVDDIFLYTSYIWRKQAGETNYNQPFHRDYPTHSLLVPPDEATVGSVNVFVYLTDVKRENGALSYVPLSKSAPFGVAAAQPSKDGQELLSEDEEFAEGPAGTVLFYNTETFHRGTDLTAKDAYRHVLGAGYRRTDMPWIGPRRGDFHPLLPMWRDIMERATPEQLGLFGVPMPGHGYWTERTIDGVQSRFPKWDSSAYRSAAGLEASQSEAPKFEWPEITDVGGVDIDKFIAQAQARAKAKLGAV